MVTEISMPHSQGLKDRYLNALQKITLQRNLGIVLQNIGLVIEVSCPGLCLAQLCEIEASIDNSLRTILCEVVGFKEDRTLVMPYEKATGIAYGCKVSALNSFATIPVGFEFIGRVVDSFGAPLDSGGSIKAAKQMAIYRQPINPLQRLSISEIFVTGIKAIDACLTLGKGQRIGLFAGSGVGKSSLISSICRNSVEQGQINIIALVGERGREVQEFVQDTLGDAGMRNSIVFAATAEQPPLIRAHAVYAAVAMAEFFSEQGREVLLVVDSMTRFAMALREVGLAIGEPPTMRGYTTSVLSALPSIAERCGRFNQRGAITGIFSVLTEGDELNDPAAETLKAILDGHIVLSPSLAQRDHYPAIDVLKSVSRLFNRLSVPEQRHAIKSLRSIIAKYEENRTLLELSMTENAAVQMIRQGYEVCSGFLQQGLEQQSALADTLMLLSRLEQELRHD